MNIQNKETTSDNISKTSTPIQYQMIPPFAENMNVLRGVVSQLALERASGAVLLSADVSGSVVKARLSAEDTARLSLRPSSEIFLSFSYSSLRWL